VAVGALATQDLEPTEAETETQERRSGSILRSPVVWILLVLVVEFVAFSLVLPQGTFFSAFNLQTLALDASVLLIVAAGQTMVIIAGGIDLSIGSVWALASVVAALVMKEVGQPDTLAIVLGIAAGIGVGAAWGSVNGLLITRLHAPDFIVTLGSLGAALGVARLLSNGQNVAGVPADLSARIGQGELLGIPIPFVIGAVTILIVGVLLRDTRFGEHTYLVGSNLEAARRGGIAVNRHKVALYILSGTLAGFAGVVDLARFGTASIATGHTSVMLASIVAVIIGGASFFGGSGVMAGTAVGVFIPVVLANGLIIGGISRFWQDIIIGVILIAAVAFDQWRRAQDLRAR
jgi:ribose transport system permease protein